ncbi:hypothetical protein [Asticcacaulis sp.]|uniref:hypothetical protein n=1 Tax=Asticcacaulis sp. TaxID=1872648 RepID=UPI003F7BF934
MAKLWTRIVMALIFVFVTVSSPLHAQAMPAHPVKAAATMAMDGMSEDCAKAMAAQSAKAMTEKHRSSGHSGGCCADGCNCPLSHCPATPPMLAAVIAAPLHVDSTIVGDHEGQTLVSFHADTLIRPPKA